MNLSEKGRRVLAQWERRRRRAYKCPAGVWTIGFGHALTGEELRTGIIHIDGQAVPWRNGLTNEQVDALLRQDLCPREACVRNAVRVPLTQTQFDALVVFVFNVGEAAFEGSTLLRKLNAGDHDAVPSELRRWNKVKGKVCDGLINRREAEIVLWNSQTAYA